MRKEVLDFFGDDWVFDGVSLGWTTKELCPKDKPMTNIVEMEARKDGKPNNIKIVVTQMNTLNMRDLVGYLRGGNFDLDPNGNKHFEPFAKWMGALFRKDPDSRFTSKPNGSAYYDNNPSTTLVLHKSTNGTLEARRGVYQSFQLRFGRMTMNIDTSTTAFWVGGRSLIDNAASFNGCRRHEILRAFKANPTLFIQNCGKLSGSFFNVRHLGERGNAKKIRIRGLKTNNAIQEEFEETQPDGSQKKISVLNYFKKKYNATLEYPELPLVWTSKGDFPMEMCFVSENERYKELLQGQETAEFIK